MWTPPAGYSASEVVTATKLNTHLRDNMKEVWREVAYVEFASTVNVTNGTHTEAAPIDVVSAGAITFTAEPILVEFFAPNVSKGTSGMGLSLWDGTDLGRIVHTGSALDVISSEANGRRRLTPSAASHTYKVRAWVNGANAGIGAGAGGVGTLMPGFIRITQKGG